MPRWDGGERVTLADWTDTTWAALLFLVGGLFLLFALIAWLLFVLITWLASR